MHCTCPLLTQSGHGRFREMSVALTIIPVGGKATTPQHPLVTKLRVTGARKYALTPVEQATTVVFFARCSEMVVN